MDRERETLGRLLQAAIAAADPEVAVARAMVRRGERLEIAGLVVPHAARLRILAAGKAAVGMAAAAARIAGDRVAAGLVVTKDGHAAAAKAPAPLVLHEAAHPVPDARSEAAGRALLAFAGEGSADEVLLVLLSGGASALLACPLPGLSLGDVARTTSLLLASGAAIDEINCVRKHLCDLTGGRLARAARGRAVALLAISDVIGDRLDVIGSGPCVPDPTRYSDALGVLRTRGLLGEVPHTVRTHLEAGVRGQRDESPKPGDGCFSKLRMAVVASNRDALVAAERTARSEGLRTVPIGAPLAGEARDVGRRLAALVRAVRPSTPTLLLAGGETTVTLCGAGRGGRSQELALAAALGLAGHAGAVLLAAGTDGTDGPTDAAGAFADGGTVARGAARGVVAAEALAANDAYGFFDAEGGLLRTGPTGTNVMDLVLLLRDAAANA